MCQKIIIKIKINNNQKSSISRKPKNDLGKNERLDGLKTQKGDPGKNQRQ